MNSHDAVLALAAMSRSAALSTRIKKAWRILGPGLITGASDDDPSGIATYSQAGTGFGFPTLWTALITFPLMAAVHRLEGRLGQEIPPGQRVLYHIDRVAHCWIVSGIYRYQSDPSAHLYSRSLRPQSAGHDCHHHAQL